MLNVVLLKASNTLERLTMTMGQLVLLAASSFVVGFSGALMPGPVFVATVVQSIRRGPAVGPLIVVGHAILESITIVALCLRFRWVMGSAVARVAIGLLGGGFLLWMGCGLIRFARKASLKLQVEVNQTALLKYNPILTGIVTSFMNPYFFIWWATVGNGFTFFGLEVAGLVGVTVFALSHWMSDLSWYTFISMSIHKGKRFMSDKIYKAVLTVCGGFLTVLSLIFIAEGLKALF